MKKSNKENLKQLLNEIEYIKSENKDLNNLETGLDNILNRIKSLNTGSFSWVENSPVCTKILDADFTLKYMSKSGIEMLNIKDIHEHYERPYPLSCYPKSVQENMLLSLQEAKKNLETIKHEDVLHGEQGNEIWFQSTIIPILNNKKELDHIMVVSIDITDIKLNNQQIFKSEAFNEAFLGTLPDIIYIFDLKKQKSKYYNNGGYFKNLGYTMQDLEDFGDDILSLLMHPKDYEIFNKVVMKQYLSAKDEDIIQYKFRIKHKKGHWIWLQSRESIFKRDTNGNPTQIIGVAGDITNQKIAEEELIQTKNRLKNTFNLSPCIIGTIDINTNKFIDTNEAVTRILGYTHKEFTSKPFYEFIHPEDLNKTSQNVAEKLEGRSFETFENRYLCKNGNYKWIAWQGTKPNKDGIVIAIGSDITEKKKQEIILNLLHNVTQSTLGKTNLDEISWIIANKVADYLNTDDCVIYFLDKNTNQLEQIAAYGAKVNSEFQISNRISIPLGNGIVGSIARSKKGEIVHDTSKDNRYIVDDQQRFSEITVPIIFEDEVIGIIDSEHHDKNFFTKENLKTLEKLADLISIQLHNAINIKEKERIQKIAQEHQELLKTTGRIAQVGGWDLDPITKKILWTQETKRIYEVDENYTPNYNDAMNFCHPDDRNKVESYIKLAIEEEIEDVFTARIITAKGNEKYLKIQGKSIFKNGKCIKLYGALQDITKERIFKKNLTKSEENYSNLLNNIPSVAWITHSEQSLIFISNNVKAITGFSAEERYKDKDWSAWTDRIHKDDLEYVQTSFSNFFEGKTEFYDVEYRFKHRNGSWLWLRDQSNSIKKVKNGYEIYGTFLDITRRKEAEIASEKAFEELTKLKNQLEKENVYLKEEVGFSFNYENMVYSSEQMSHLLTQVEQVAPTDATVLILGETGTGKELIAKAIHNTSQRKDNALIRVNCATIPAELIESELFGHIKGSFTGAIDNRIGKFELADGGTLFLDEIGELPLHLQPKLLRAIQEGEIEPIGSSKLKKLNVRIIAATNRDLKKESQEKRFREDLYFRLNVFPIKIPALRDRVEDIPILIDHFVDKYCKKHNKEIKYISDAMLNKMRTYSWPGNIRELENIIERGVIISSDNTLITPEFSSSNSTSNKKTIIGEQSSTLAEVQRNHIIKILNQTKWKIDGENGASKILDLKPSTLRDRMKKLGIKRIKK